MGNHVACIFGGIGFDLYSFLQGQMGLLILFSPQPVKPLRVLGYCFHPWSPDGWAGGRLGGGKSLSGLYLRNRNVQEVNTW